MRIGDHLLLQILSASWYAGYKWPALKYSPLIRVRDIKDEWLKNASFDKVGHFFIGDQNEYRYRIFVFYRSEVL